MSRESRFKRLLKKKKSSGDDKYHLTNFVRNWLHQALSYMDKGELLFRALLEVAMIAFIYFCLTVLSPGVSGGVKILVAFILAHTLNWLMNGNFWALFLFAVPASRNRGKLATEKYLNDMAIRMKASRCVGGLALFGSVARGAWHQRSDLDIRVIREKGLFNLLCANILVMRERVIALFAMQPVDMFLADGVEFLKRMRKDEAPVFLIKRTSELQSEYPDNDAVHGVTLPASESS